MTEDKELCPSGPMDEFLAELRALLAKYDCELVAGDDGEPYGLATPLIRVEFNHPYEVREFESISREAN